MCWEDSMTYWAHDSRIEEGTALRDLEKESTLPHASVHEQWHRCRLAQRAVYQS